MKNNCDVSGNTTRCQRESDCSELVPIGSDNNHCVYCTVDWACTKVKAIRAAIEAEQINKDAEIAKFSLIRENPDGTINGEETKLAIINRIIEVMKETE